MIKGVKVEGRGIKETVEEVIKEMKIEVDIEEVRRTGGKDKKGREMIVVRLKNEEQKRRIMERKRNLKDRKEWVEED